ncbi:hypothetical protein Vadar_023395 [Vaccinium darrowii]|uniref:Uncharacterized protein n=1 Tax=Vaccinium darrowii TaxID=229202 RepID=A0ACB7YQ28_9ERIC|nr:hypothetical protein Vadar_023395 [Vaccinium darrowii]
MKLKYKPEVLMGGKHLVYDCAVSRSIEYFLEPPIVFGLLGNDSRDSFVDTFRSTTLPILKGFGAPSEGLDLKIDSRGVPPHGGGEAILSARVVK